MRRSIFDQENVPIFNFFFDVQVDDTMASNITAGRGGGGAATQTTAGLPDTGAPAIG